MLLATVSTIIEFDAEGILGYTITILWYVYVSCNLNKGRSGRRRTERCLENIQAVREALENQEDGAPRISARRNGLGLTSATFNRITRLDLGFHPYRMIKRHQLLDNDYPRRENFCQWLLRQNRRLLEDVVIGDEAGFALNATVNTHNDREYHPRGEKPLDFDYQRNDDRHKLTGNVASRAEREVSNIIGYISSTNLVFNGKLSIRRISSVV